MESVMRILETELGVVKIQLGSFFKSKLRIKRLKLAIVMYASDNLVNTMGTNNTSSNCDSFDSSIVNGTGQSL